MDHDHKIATLPNMMSFLRLLMIPLIVILYQKGRQIDAAMMVAISGATDVADGFVARKYDQVTDLGKVLDPLADKLTLAALLGCLSLRYRQMAWLLVLLVVKETVMIIAGIVVLRRTETINSAKWYGKIATFSLYAVVFLLIVFPSFPDPAITAVTYGISWVMILSCVKYICRYKMLIKENIQNMQKKSE